jgi:hypothetical protein
MRPRYTLRPHALAHSHTHSRALRAYRSPPRTRGQAARPPALPAAAGHLRAADAVAAYAAACVCVVCAGVLACGVAGLARALYADVGRKTRARAAGFAAAAAECAREWEENGCGGRPGTSAVGRMCRQWGSCMERERWAEWDAVSGVVWAEAVSECGRAFVDGAGGVAGVLGIVSVAAVLAGGLGGVWAWALGGRRRGGRASGRVEERDLAEWTEVGDGDAGDEVYVQMPVPRLPTLPQRFVTARRGFADGRRGNGLALTPKRAPLVSITREPPPAR